MDFLKLIQEGRVDDFRAKYSQKFGEENIKKILKVVPQKYLDWVGKNMDGVNFDENLSILGKVLDGFQKISSNLPITDLYQYKSIGQLYSALTDYQKRQRRIVKKVDGGNVVYDDGRFFVVNPLTHDTSCYYGKGTKWCTAASTDHQFKRYNEDGKLFYILDRQAPSDNKFYKVALLQKFDGDRTYYDALDATVNNGWIIGTNKLNEILGSVDEYINDQYPEQVKIYKDKELARKEKERLERERQAQILRQREAEAQERRIENEWALGPDCPDQGLRAHALLEFLSDNNDAEILTNVDRGEIARIETEIDRLQSEYDNDDEVRNDLLAEIEELEDELEELKQKIDVYNIIPTGSYYDTDEFEVIGVPELEDRRYAVGNEREMQTSAEEYVVQLIDDMGFEGFNSNFVRQHLDYDAVIAYAEDLFNQDVYQNPEIYIEESERELSRKQEEDVKVREDKIQRLSEYISRLESDMDGEDDEEIQEKIDELQESIDEMEQEIEEIKEDPEGDFPDELIEEIISDRVREANNDIEGFMNEWGLEWNEYVDKDAFIKAVIDEDGYGHTLNGYDGSADEVTIQDELFYVMRID
jgi:peptidoglycan hydrolase CwlO-like protein